MYYLQETAQLIAKKSCSMLGVLLFSTQAFFESSREL